MYRHSVGVRGDGPPSRVVLVWRRLVYCTFGHRFMFVRTPQDLRLVCPHCLTTRIVNLPKVLHG